jgi:mRNA interferase MazF
MARTLKRFDVYLVNLDPTIGSEIKKTRPCVIISPEEIHFLKTCIIAPLTSTIRTLPCRVPVQLNHIPGEIALDQLRAIDNSRLVKKLGSLKTHEADQVVSVLLEMFSY